MAQAYKEPWSVLSITLDSLSTQTVPTERRCVVLALESRDPSAQATFERAKDVYGRKFAALWGTLHELIPGEEVAGKGSNENFAVRWLFSVLAADGHRGQHEYGGGSFKAGRELRHGRDSGGSSPGLARVDPANVMVTICDADSDFAPRFLEQLENTHYQQIDGRRCIYGGALNTWANFADEPNPLIRQHEIQRSINAINKMWLDPALHTQSNYSLTLALCDMIGYWTPDNLPEDVHTGAC